MECEACRSKGPGWPTFLDFSKLMPYDKCCLWCKGTKEVTVEVAEVYQRFSTEPNLLSVRATSLASRAIDAKRAWEEVQKKKRPKGYSEIEWAAMLTKTEQTAKQAQAEWQLAQDSLVRGGVSERGGHA